MWTYLKGADTAGFMRTPTDGLLPYNSGMQKYSYLGTPSWKFGECNVATGKFDALTIGGNAIFSTGSTDGGKRQYIRFANGIQIVYMNLPFSMPCNNTLNGYYWGSDYWSFPVSFVDVPVVQTDFTHSNVAWSTATSATTKSQVGHMLVTISSSTISGTFQCIAIGRWY